MNATEERGPIKSPRHQKPKNNRLPEVCTIPNLEVKLRVMQDDLNRQTGRDDEFSWSAPWLDQAMTMLQIQHARRN